MRRRLYISLVAALATLPLGALSAAAGLTIHIDKAAQVMTVSEDGRFLHQWPVSTGIARYDTPGGRYRPFRMEKEHFSEEWDNAPMPFSIFFTKRGHAIHGTTHKGLGQPASHGCVRLSVKNAATLWALVKRAKMANTEVVLFGEIPGGPPAVAETRRERNVAGAPSYRRRWSNNPGYYEENGRRYYYGRYYYDDRPPPPPAYIPPQRYDRYGNRNYRYGDRYYDERPPQPPFPFFFGQ